MNEKQNFLLMNWGNYVGRCDPADILDEAKARVALETFAIAFDEIKRLAPESRIVPVSSVTPLKGA